MATFHPRLATPPYLPELVPLPPALSGSQLLTLSAVLHCSRDRDGEFVAPPTLRQIAESIGVRFKSSGRVKADLLALVEMGRVEIDQCVNAKLWKITDLGRWHFPPHMRSGLNGDVRRYARAALAKAEAL